MGIQVLKSFFMWSIIINFSYYLLWLFFLIVCPDFVYKVQSKFFPLSRETFNIVIYSFLGAFKIFFLFFNVTPYVALLIVG